jgi:adenylate kinase
MVEAGTNYSEKEKNRGRLLIFVGPEGSGKSTQAKKISEALNLPYISTGDIIRERAQNDSFAIGDLCRSMLEEHTYLESKTLLSLLKSRLSHDDVEKGAVIDGALRTTEEIDTFEEMLIGTKAQGKEITVIFLKTAGWESVERLLKRGRPDDSSEAILSRLYNYYMSLSERSSKIKKNWKFVQVLANGLTDDRDEKWKQIEETHKLIMKKVVDDE